MYPEAQIATNWRATCWLANWRPTVGRPGNWRPAGSPTVWPDTLVFKIENLKIDKYYIQNPKSRTNSEFCT